VGRGERHAGLLGGGLERGVVLAELVEGNAEVGVPPRHARVLLHGLFEGLRRGAVTVEPKVGDAHFVVELQVAGRGLAGLRQDLEGAGELAPIDERL
jgi:hypothetical protein